MIDKVFYINLANRIDRKEHIEQELTKYGLEYERYNAIPVPTHGILGCGLSHLNVLKLAKKRKYKNVLIFEDDFQFLVTPEEFKFQMNSLFECGLEFDCVMLGYNVREFEELDHPIVNRLLFGVTASAYIVNAHYYDVLIDLFEYCLPRLRDTREHWLYANDIAWKPLQERDRWYYFKTRIGKQMDGYSDVSNADVSRDV